MSKKYVLIVEDEEDFLFLLEKQLSRKYDVVTASDGDKALVVLKNNKDIKLIISDIRMPGQYNGVELMNVVKLTYSPVPVFIFMTAFSYYDPVEVIKEGAFAFLKKPFNLSELYPLIDEVLQD